MKLNSDHRNSISRQMPAAGATTGIQFHGKCPPQARPAESLFTAILTVGGGDRWSLPHFVLIPASYNFPARGANTARLRAIKREGYSENVVTVTPLSERARGCVNRICYCACAHAEGMGAPLSSLRDTFPSQHLTFGSSCTVIFDQVRKALLRIKILC